LQLSAGKKRVQPVLLVWDGPVSEDMLQAMLEFKELYLLRRPPLLSSSMVAGNLEAALRIVLLMSQRAATSSGHTAAAHSSFSSISRDSSVIFAYQYIREHHPRAADRTVCEICQNDSLEFMVPESIDEDINATPPPNLTRRFAEGRVYSGSLTTTLLAHALFKPDVLPIAEALISTHITNENMTMLRAAEIASVEESGAVGGGLSPWQAMMDVEVLQAEVPERLQNKTYGFVVETLLLENDVLPLGLFRHDKAGSGGHFTFTNPKPNTPISHLDKIFILSRRPRDDGAA